MSVKAIPTEAPIWATPFSSVNGSARLSTMRCATVSAATSEVACSSRTANSSPPRRETVSVARTHLLSLHRHLDEDLVPGGVTEAVVDLLELVEVDVQEEDEAAGSLGTMVGALEMVHE